MDATEQKPLDMSSLFRAPAARGIKVLDRSLFSKKLPTTAAMVKDNRNIAKYRKELQKSRDLLLLPRLNAIIAHPDPAIARKGTKCIILNPEVNPSRSAAYSPELKEATEKGEVELFRYDLDVGYDLWGYVDVMKSILPESKEFEEIPSGFNTVGHIAHLNLREPFTEYKHVIAQVILDKNNAIKTVINKIADVGAENEFRTFNYELLAGPDDLMVEVSQLDCVFKFDYSKVYFNTKLSNEHERLVSKFQPGEVVADVMAGVGPFAVPAGKRGVFVWANDKNPESCNYMKDAIKRNKVGEFVRPFNDDGHDFIKTVSTSVLEASKLGDFAKVQVSKPSRKEKGPPPEPKHVPVPPTISHFVMNLPASAIEFLHNFLGIYEGQEQLFEPHTMTKLPLVHVHCFATKADDDTPYVEILQRLEKELGITFTRGPNDGDVDIQFVRDVAPAKSMFCVSFRIPADMAFARSS